MALQVWLPLTKDLRNQGLSNVTVTNNGATFNSAGKLGGCYSFGTGASALSLPASTFTSLTGDFSIACWVKIISWNTSYATVWAATSTSASYANIIAGMFRNSTSSKILFCIGNNSSSTQTSCMITNDISLNVWNHFVCTYTAGKILLYQNGELVSSYNTSIVPAFSTTQYVNIGKMRESTYQSNCSVNDFRLYNHCLSPMEVKELSKGLVLHYPLNRGGWGQENLLSGNNAKITTWTNYMPDSVILSGDGYDNKYTLIKGIGGWEKIFTDAITVTSGKTYTLSFDYSVEQNYTGYSGQFGLSVCTTSQAKYGADTDVITKVNFGTVQKSKSRTSVTFTATSNTIYLVANGGNINDGQENISFYISYIKLEEGSIATPWCPNSSDAFATAMGLNGTTEYDTSGFCNNGEYYAYDTNGSISYTSDTPKYNVSTHIASANPTQNAASGTRYLYGHCELTNPTQMSVAFWLKPITGGYGGTTSNGQGYFCTTNYEYGDTNVGTDYQASAMNHRDGAVNMNDSASTTQCNVTFYPTIGEWHHYVYTYDGQVGRGYKDGVQTATAQFSAAKTLDSFIGVVIGFSRAGGIWRRNDACYSDFRIYATALSADDVKSLYQNSAYIDNSGNVYGAVHSEV